MKPWGCVIVGWVCLALALLVGAVTVGPCVGYLVDRRGTIQEAPLLSASETEELARLLDLEDRGPWEGCVLMRYDGYDCSVFARIERPPSRVRLLGTSWGDPVPLSTFRSAGTFPMPVAYKPPWWNVPPYRDTDTAYMTMVEGERCLAVERREGEKYICYLLRGAQTDRVDGALLRALRRYLYVRRSLFPGGSSVYAVRCRRGDR